MAQKVDEKRANRPRVQRSPTSNKLKAFDEEGECKRMVPTKKASRTEKTTSQGTLALVPLASVLERRYCRRRKHISLSVAGPTRFIITHSSTSENTVPYSMHSQLAATKVPLTNTHLNILRACYLGEPTSYTSIYDRLLK